MRPLRDCISGIDRFFHHFFQCIQRAGGEYAGYIPNRLDLKQSGISYAFCKEGGASDSSAAMDVGDFHTLSLKRIKGMLNRHI